MRFAYNTSPGPVVVDSAGRTVAGHDWANVNEDNTEVRHAVSLGQLVWRDQPPADTDDPVAVAAYQYQPPADPQPATPDVEAAP